MICLHPMTAIAAWRLASTGRIAMPEPCELRSLRGLEARASELEGLPEELLDEEGVAHVMVADERARHQSRRICCHRLTARDFPRGSFCSMGGEVLLPIPELCFVMMGGLLERSELLRLGMELCGRYRRTTEGTSWWVEPLTDADSMGRYARDCQGVHGRMPAIEAARHLVDGSASPRESLVCLLLVMPTRMGGYQLPHPVMNLPMELEEAARLISGQRQAAGDLYWPEAAVIVEYDSDAAHVPRRSHDMERRDGLESMGIRVMTITTAQARDFARLDACLMRVKRLLTGRNRPVSPEARERRCLLFRKLATPSPLVC